jgi:peptide/nickel transport system substrate-binding protein
LRQRTTRAGCLLALALLLVGCQSPTAQRTDSAAVSHPVNGDRLVIPIISDPPSLDFLTCTDAWCLLVARFVADSLVDEGENLETVPRIASSWEFSEQGRVLTFHLRTGVRWHDGAPFTSRDVLYTYRRTIDPASGARADQFQDVQEVTAPDDFTVKVRFHQPTVLALDMWKVPLLPEHLSAEGAKDTAPSGPRHPIGTGPFRFVRSERGREIVLDANPDYFLGRPYLDGIDFRVIPAPATQFQALLTGETDWSPIPAAEWSKKSSQPEFRKQFQIFEYPALFLHYIGWNERGPLFSDAKVRMAMTLALDREGFVNKVFNGAGVAAAGTFHPGHFGFDSALKPLPYDPEQAARLLDEAGWRPTPPHGIRRRGGREFRFTLLIFQGDPMQQQVASLLSDSLGRLGVQMEIKVLDFPALLERLHRHDFEAVLSGWVLSSNPDPTSMLHSDPVLGPSNYVGYSNAEMDRLLLDARHETDPGKRRAILHRLQELQARDQPYTFLFFPVSRVALDGRFRDVRPSPVASPLKPYPGPLRWYVPTQLQKRTGPT